MNRSSLNLSVDDRTTRSGGGGGLQEGTAKRRRPPGGSATLRRASSEPTTSAAERPKARRPLSIGRIWHRSRWKMPLPEKERNCALEDTQKLENQWATPMH